MDLTSVDPDRFWRRVDRSGECWLWTGALRPTGYGVTYIPDGQTTTSAHRVAFVLSGGVIPDGYQIDHLCRNRGCVNPAHLEAVTPRENVHRSQAPWLTAMRAGRCMSGRHDSSGGQCQKCKTERQRERRKAARQANPPVGPGSFQRSKTYCPQGHPYDAENTYEYNGRRMCRECMRTRTKARRMAA